MTRIFSFFILLALSLYTTDSCAAKRLALVIGNSTYNFSPLKNPVNDAKLIAEKLEETGFDVTLHLNVNQRNLRRAVRDFGQSLIDNGEDAVGLFYYAGHGLQVNGVNYMVPVQVDIRTEGDVEIESVRVESVLNYMGDAGNRLNFVILDACRNNPFSRSVRSGTRGLARMDAPGGTLIAYATSPGDVALDGKGDNSPYSLALARHLTTPGVMVEQMLKNVRIAVQDETSERQLPWESSSLTGDFYFVPEKPKPAVPPQQSSSVPQPTKIDVELEFWRSVSSRGTVAEYQAYIEAYPQGRFAPLAALRISALELPTKISSSKSTSSIANSPSNPVQAPLSENVAKRPPQQLASVALTTPVPNSDGAACTRLLGRDEMEWWQLPVRPTEGIAACRRALQITPNNPRYMYQLARGLDKMHQNEEAVQWYRKAAEQGWPDALVGLGSMYQHGAGVTQDVDEALRLYKKAAESNQPRTLLALGNAYESGIGTDISHSVAFSYFKQAADLGEPNGLNHLALSYEQGYGVEKNIGRAIELYKQAGKAGVGWAWVNLASLYRTELQDFDRSRQLAQQMADKGHYGGFNQLGHLYSNGEGVEKDINKAISYYKRSGEMGYDWGWINIARLYRKGTKIKEDKSKSLNILNMLSQHPNSVANNDLGIHYEHGYEVEKNLILAFDYYKKSALAGYRWGNYNLATLYYKGKGVKKDYHKSFKLFQKALKRNVGKAAAYIGYHYHFGRYVEKNYKKALEYYEKSVDLGYNYGLIEVANMYQRGLGVEKNYAIAKDYYQKAIDKNVTRGYYKMGDLYYYGYGVDKNYQTALRNYQFAAEKGYTAAMRDLGYMYETGKGVTLSEEEALHWYRKLSDKGDGYGEFKIGWFTEHSMGGLNYNYEEAISWYKKAAKNNYKKAINRLKKLGEYDL